MKVRDLVKLLKDNGWVEIRKGKGDHVVYGNPNFPNPISVDGQPGDDIPKGTLNSYLRDAGLK